MRLTFFLEITGYNSRIMESLRKLYRMGNGPSSSHTMAPRIAAEQFRQRHPRADRIRVQLFGSLAATGRGHLTDIAVRQALEPIPVEFVWTAEQELPLHPNGLRFTAYDESGAQLAEWDVYSTGGGALLDPTTPPDEHHLYDLHSMREILKFCTQTGRSFWEYVESIEGPDIWDYLRSVKQIMYHSIERGLHAEGVLPGGLGISRKASSIYRRIYIHGPNFLNKGYVTAYALAVAEENACGGLIATAPTCGSSGVLPAVLKHIEDNLDCHEEEILHAMATAGLIGNLIKFNASIHNQRKLYFRHRRKCFEGV
jgi:L-serine dehydratase